MKNKDIFEKLTSEEKISLFDGLNVWQTRPINRLKIKSVWMSDGPHGIRKEIIENGNVSVIKNIVYPTAALVSCSFDENIAYLFGKSIANDAFNNDVNLILGPGLNIKRHPLGGRNFEYFSEDPYLNGVLGYSYVNGAKSENVDCCLKHYALNSQETNRFVYSSDADLHTLYDLYLFPFYLAIKNSDVAAVMSAYNRVNGIYCGENKFLLDDVLRNKFAFKGMVVTDWGALNDPIDSFKNGLNLVMPGNNKYVLDAINKAYRNKCITDYEIDKAIEPTFDFIMKHQDIDKSKFQYNLQENINNAYKIASESIVLAKNEKEILPLNKNEKIGIIGQFAKNIHVQGGGSSKINPIYLEQILNVMDDNKYPYDYADGYDISSQSTNENLINQAIEVAKKSDKIVVFLGLFDDLETEGEDKISMSLPSFMPDLIDKLYEFNKNIVCVIFAGSPVELPFYDKVNAIVLPYLCGCKGSSALVDILYGDVNPSGHLSETWPFDIASTYLGNDFPSKNKYIPYKEGLYVGYRYYDGFNKDVRFCFGHGLTYSKFSYSDFKIDGNQLSFKIENLSKIDGKTLVQLYVKDDVNNFKQLKYFKKIFVSANKSVDVKIMLNDEMFSSYDDEIKFYNVKKGKYKIYLGESIDNIYYSFDYEIKEGSINYKYNINMQIDSKISIDNSKKPNFDMNSSLNDFKSTRMGRFINKIFAKEFNKRFKDDDPNKEMMFNQMMNTPLRGVINYANSKTFDMRLGHLIVDILNGKYLKGIKNYFKK